jgi:hypothetical protein
VECWTKRKQLKQSRYPRSEENPRLKLFIQILESGDQVFVQGAIRLASGQHRSVSNNFQRAIDVWSLYSFESFSLRYELDSFGSLTLTILVTCLKEKEEQLRKFLGRVSLISGSRVCEVEICQSEKHLEAWRESWLGPTLVQVNDLETRDGLPILLRGIWPGIVEGTMTSLANAGVEASFHVNISPGIASNTLKKVWANTKLNLEFSKAPTGLQQFQRQELEGALEASYEVEAFWSVRTPHRDSLEKLLRKNVELQVKAVSGFEIHQWAATMPLGVSEGVHTNLMFAKSELEHGSAFGRATQTEAAELCRWPRLPTSVNPSSDPSQDPSSEDGPLDGGRRVGMMPSPKPTKSTKGFAFISYARADSAFVYQILEQFSEAGIEIWYDQNIPVGEEWDEMLAHQLENASTILFFASKQSLKSRYCKREIAYADIAKKPITPIMLEEIEFSGSFGLLLSSIQKIDSRDVSFIEKIKTFTHPHNKGMRPN